jgi:hypothetical protein
VHGAHALSRTSPDLLPAFTGPGAKKGPAQGRPGQGRPGQGRPGQGRQGRAAPGRPAPGRPADSGARSESLDLIKG